MFALPAWLKLTAATVREDSRLQPHMIMAAMDETAMDADIEKRIPTQAATVLRRIGNAVRPLGINYVYTEAQKESIIEAVKLKVIQSLTATDPTELVAAVSKAAKQEAIEIMVELENELEDLAAAAMKSNASSGSTNFSRNGHLPREYLDNLLAQSGIMICRPIDDD